MQAPHSLGTTVFAHPLMQGPRSDVLPAPNRSHDGRDDTSVRQSREQQLVVNKEPAVKHADQSTDRPAAASESTFSLRYRGSARTALLIETQEGDTVRLKIKATESLKVDAARLEDGDRVVSSAQLQNRSRTSISLIVNGDLNAEELASIQSIVEQASKLASDFFSGDLNGAFKAATELDVDGQQLAKVGLKMRMKEQLTYSQHSVRNALAVPPEKSAQSHLASSDRTVPKSEPAPVTPPTAVEQRTARPAVVAQTPTENAESVSPASPALEVPPARPSAESTNTVSPSSQRPLSMVANRGLTPAGNGPLDFMQDMLSVIADFLTQLADAFDQIQADSEPSDADSMGGQMSVSTTLKFKIFESVLVSASELAANEASSDSARDVLESSSDDDGVPALVAETVEAVAAARQEPVSATA